MWWLIYLIFIMMLSLLIVRFMASRTNKMHWFEFFDTMLGDVLKNRIKVIVWDLDCTLGASPGWDGKEPLLNYIKHNETLSVLLEYLRAEYGVIHVLVSNNSMFCEKNLYKKLFDDFYELGFDDVKFNNRLKMYEISSKIARIEHVKRNEILLIDDQPVEVENAVDDGGHALHVELPLFDAINHAKVTLHVTSFED